MKVSKNFERSEFACKCGCGFDTIDVKLLEAVQLVRDHFKQPVSINSACRCRTHNQAVGGMLSSYHLTGKAADIVVKNVTPRAVQEFLEAHYPSHMGIGSYRSFTHIDSRETKGRWNG